MTNQEFKREIDKLLKPYGFKNKGNKWKAETEELEKLIHLQKSDYNNSYYLNYGYNFKDLEYTCVSMHVWNRLGYTKRKKNKQFIKTLDLTSSMDRVVRMRNLKYFIEELLFTKINLFNSKSDIIQDLKSRKNLNGIFLPVKQHLNLETYKKTSCKKDYNSFWQKVKLIFKL